MTRIQETAAATLPATVSTRFQGTAQAFQDSLRGLGLILVMAIVVIYIVLGILYESFTQPLVILSGLPAAGFGALLTLLIFKSELSLYAFVGVIMLVGLVKKNGIMMVDFAAVAEREHGKTPLEAIHEACLVRFRPIMMTTMCALVGTLPIALGLGRGRRIAASARPGGRRRAAGLAAADALHHAGVLRVHRERAPAAGEAQGEDAGRNGTSGRVRTRQWNAPGFRSGSCRSFSSSRSGTRRCLHCRHRRSCGVSAHDRRCRLRSSSRVSSSPASASPPACAVACAGPGAVPLAKLSLILFGIEAVMRLSTRVDLGSAPPVRVYRWRSSSSCTTPRGICISNYPVASGRCMA